MKVIVTRKRGETGHGDTISIFDYDGREIAVPRHRLPELVKLLQKAYRRGK